MSYNWENTRIATEIIIFKADGTVQKLGDNEGWYTLKGVTLWNARTVHTRKKQSSIYSHNNGYAEIDTDYRFRIVTPVTYEDVEILREVADHKLYFTVRVKPRGFDTGSLEDTEFKLRGEIYGGCKIDKEEYTIEVDDGPPLAVFEGQALRKDRLTKDNAPLGDGGDTWGNLTNMAFGSGIPQADPFAGTDFAPTT